MKRPPPPPLPLPVPDPSPPTAALRAWLLAHPGAALGVEFGLDATGGGRCAVAPAPGGLAAGAVVATVPDAACLTATAGEAGDALRAAGLARDGDDEGDGGQHSPRRAWRDAAALALALLAERALGPASAWAPYVAWLYAAPQAHADAPPHPALWSPSAARALAGTAAGRRLRRPSLHAPSAVDAAWAGLARPWLARVGLAATTQAEFRAALAIVSAYAFTLGDASVLALVPAFDVLNTRPGGPPPVTLSHDAGAVGAAACSAACGRGGRHHHHHHHHAAGGALTMRTTAPVPAGAQVFNSYGRLAAGELLRRYGIVPPASPTPSPDDALDFTPAAIGAAAAAVLAPPRPVARARRAAAGAAAAGGALRAAGDGTPSRALLAAAAAAGGSPAHAKAVLARVVADRVGALERPVRGVADARVAAAGGRVRAIEAGVARRLGAWVERTVWEG